MVRKHRWSVMIHGSRQAEIMEYSGQIHRYGTRIFGKIAVYASKLVNNDRQILWKMISGNLSL